MDLGVYAGRTDGRTDRQSGKTRNPVMRLIVTAAQ